METIKAASHQFLVTELATECESFRSDENLLEQGVIDSLAIVKLVGFLEEHFQIEVDDPQVREAAVVAVPDEQIGSRIKGYVSGADGEEFVVGRLREYCLERLRRYMVPEVIEVLPQLPKTSTGKVDRTRLAEGA